MSALVASRLGLDPCEVARIERGGLVHDVGKIIVSPEILEKPGALTHAEFAEVKRHAVFGARLVSSLDDPKLTAIVRHHHERLDGSGYPDGLRGDAIPIEARVVAVSDAFSAITSDRVYARGRATEEALRELRRSSGAHHDPAVVEALAPALELRRGSSSLRLDAEAA